MCCFSIYNWSFSNSSVGGRCGGPMMKECQQTLGHLVENADEEADRKGQPIQTFFDDGCKSKLK